MIATFQALVIALVAVLPGASYTAARETRGASWAWRQTDAGTILFRFLGFSAVFHAIFAPLTYHAYQKLVVTHDVTNGNTLSWNWYWVLLAYVVLPYAFGAFTEWGRRVKGLNRVVALWAGKSPELRAWDSLFSREPKGVMRMKLNNGEWKLGLYAGASSASGYGESGDLFIAKQYFIREDGVPFFKNDDYVPTGDALLIKWSDVTYVDFTPWPKSAAVDEKKNGRILGWPKRRQAATQAALKPQP